jgi:hypothetical protein
MGAPRIQISAETAISDLEIAQLAQIPPPIDDPIRFIGIARLLHWKGFATVRRYLAKSH